MTTSVKIDARRIFDRESFHDVFAEHFGFPEFYGRNMNAWIDCMTDLDDPGAGMTSIHPPPRGVLTIELEHAGDFARRSPELYQAIVESSALVNLRKIQNGGASVLALAFWKQGEKKK